MSREIDSILDETLSVLQSRDLETAEVHHKKGRSRRVEIAKGVVSTVLSREEGWAVRAGGARGSFFAAGTGPVIPGGPWPETRGETLRLPGPSVPAPWKAPQQLDSPLMGESEACSVLETVSRVLEQELPGARVLQAILEDGGSESQLVSSRGVRTRWRARAANLYLEVRGPDSGRSSISWLMCEQEGRRFRPQALARRLADELTVMKHGGSPDRDRGEFLLSPLVGAKLLCGLIPLLVGPDAAARCRELQDADGRLGSEHLTIVDDGRHPGGLLAAAVDGEGVPTRRCVLVESGVFRQPLLAWWQQPEGRNLASGCSRRASFRDFPQPGPTHFFIEPRERVSVADLLAGVSRGYYLLDSLEGGHFHYQGGRFSIPVCGFSVKGGQAVEQIGRAWISGSLTGLLRGVQGVARDLTFFPLDGMVGAPSLLLTGLEIDSSPVL